MAMNQQQTALCVAFEAMEHDKQMDTLQKEGVYVGKLKEGTGTRLLYQYQTVYVEVIYLVHRLQVAEVHCFTDTGVLDRYLSSPDFDKHGLG
jgi:hypothetical protein